MNEPAPEAREQSENFGVVSALIATRQTVLPKRLIDPGPTAEQLEELWSLAAAAPDHGLLTPWRFIVVPAAQRHRLAEVFAQALIDRDAQATPEQIDPGAREGAPCAAADAGRGLPGPARARHADARAHGVDGRGHPEPAARRACHGLRRRPHQRAGDGSPRLRALCGLAEGEVPVCCVNIGTATRRSQRAAPRPLPAQFVSELADDSTRGGV